MDKIVNNPELRALAYTIMDETVATANAELQAVFGSEAGEPLGEAEKEQMMNLSDGMGAYKTSTMLDMTNRRAMEVRYLFREPVKRAERLGMSVPQLQSTVVIMEAFQQKYCDENLMIGRWETLEDAVHQAKFICGLSQQTPTTNEVIVEQLIRTFLSSLEDRLEERFLHNTSGSTSPNETVFDLISLLYSLGKLDCFNRKRPTTRDNQQTVLESLAKRIWLKLENAYQKSNSSRLSEGPSPFESISKSWTLWETAQDLGLVDETHGTPSSSSTLYAHLCQRLSKGDALAQLSPVQLVLALKALTRRSSASPYGAHYDFQNSSDNVFLRAVMRRLRKQSIRENLAPGLIPQSLVAVLFTVEENLQQTHHYKHSVGDSMTNEQALFLFALVKEQLRQLEQTSSANKSNHDHEKNVLTLSEAAVLFRSAKRVATKPNTRQSDQRMRESLQRMLLHNTTTKTAPDGAESRLFAIATILETLAEWKDDTQVDRQCLDMMGNILWVDYSASLLQTSSTSTRQFNRILRSMAILGKNYTTVGANDNKDSFRMLANHILKQDALLQASNFSFMSNFLWFASVHGVSPSTAHHLTNHIARLSGTLDAHDSILRSELFCSPKLACRILSSMTRLMLFLQSQQAEAFFEDDEASNEVHILQIQANLFQTIENFGEHLLSTQIETLDAANAMMVFAKASYVQDPGVFDHLATVLVTQLHECTTRQLVQGLWAMAKMVQLETETDDIPYLTYASHMAEHACQRASDLNAKDVAQIIWAFARLDYTADDLDLEGLIQQTRKVVPEMTAHEISISLWGLSKIKPDAFDAVFLLTKRLQSENIRDTLNLREAATVIYSLGRLNVREEFVFEKLSKKIFDIVNDDKTYSASAAAAISNILWAHKKVHLTPPQEILDAWASKKLGLVPVTSMIKDPTGDIM